MNKAKWLNSIILISFLTFVITSYAMDYNDGKETTMSLINLLKGMLKILPCAFILIGLFEVWIKKETVISHLGNDSGFKGYLWALLLAGFTVGGLYVAFPLAESLSKKGASLKFIFTYLGFAGVFRIPMTIFEISFLGLPFTLVRLLVTIPLFLLLGVFLGSVLKKREYKFRH